MIGVIGDGEIATPTQRIPFDTQDILHATGIASVAIAHDIDAVWILPGSRFWQKTRHRSFWRFDGLFGSPEHWHIYTLCDDGMQIPYYAAIRPKTHYGDIRIYNDIAHKWMLPASADAQTLARQIATYERLMTVPTSYSPAQTALDLLKKTCATPARAGWLAPLSASSYAAIPWSGEWQLKHDNRQCPQRHYVHVYDKNFAFGAACKHEFGSGEPAHVPVIMTDLSDRIAQNKTYGLWCISAVPVEPQDARLPSPWGRDVEYIHREWFYTPQIALAVSMGYSVVFHEGYHWPRKHRIFDEYVDRIWMARHVARRYDGVEAMIKASFNRARGVTAHLIDDLDRLRWYHRPDWSATMSAVHYQRMLLSIQALSRRADCDYLAVDIDSVALASDSPQIDIPGLGAGRLGSYRHVATYGGDAARRLIDCAREGGSPYVLMREIDREGQHALLSNAPGQ